ncbi:tyrosine-protein phosphatase non-receptor type 4-like isoform X2 [Varroa destructor]|uniref:Uncharacterized protein n=1 Tax=Varroa destructor TaxID=109461 RepID=A0A7M7JXI4_VARDE|nr:tyrosine-protein phosphatase non-receptor type 4-like isoform X2 [Varroa destructor]XP_022658543.1 tyrosine-protein phosphatase non-receptor type 4-like isoform X2 [Varroa destructor]
MSDSEASEAKSRESTARTTSKKEAILAFLKIPKISSKGKQRYTMAQAASESVNSVTKLECGCIVDYFKKAFVFSSSWCNGSPTTKLKPCSWSQVEIIKNESVDSDEFCGSSTSSVTASDSGLSSGDNTSAESSPKLLNACTRFTDALNLTERASSPDPPTPPVKPPRLLKKRKDALAALSSGIPAPVASSTIPVVIRDPNDVIGSSAVTVQPSPSSIPVPRVTSQRSPLRTHTFSFGFHSPRSLGMKVSGGFDTEFPVAVVSVEETSPAHGRIKEGDLLWSLDGVQLQGLDHQQVVQQLSNICVQRAEVTLVVLPYQGRSLELSMAKLQGVVERQTLRAMYYRVPRSYPGCTIKASLANPKKNRYSDISAYDSTRVILTPTEFNGQSDYINANYVNMSIPGTQVINRYIATQGPRSTTVEDFWQMVLEQGCQLIVMLTPLQEGNTPKCHKYWPDQDTPLRVNCLRGWDVWQTGKTQGSAWITRQFRLRCEASNEERLVKHLQYTTWPDHGAPRDSRDFIDFVHLVRDIRSEAPLAPVIVHCSAGIGRTGVLIMMETAMCLIEFGKAVWPEEMLRTMREQRAGLIQAEIQFSFVVGAILRVFFDGEVLPKNV